MTLKNPCPLQKIDTCERIKEKDLKKYDGVIFRLAQVFMHVCKLTVNSLISPKWSYRVTLVARGGMLITDMSIAKSNDDGWICVSFRTI